MLRIEFRVQGDVCTLRLRGRFLTGSDSDYERAREALRQADTRKLIVDCRDLDYIDSTGLAFVMGLRNELAARGGALALLGPNRKVRGVLAITYLDRVLAVCDDHAQAIQALEPAMAMA